MGGLSHFATTRSREHTFTHEDESGTDIICISSDRRVKPSNGKDSIVIWVFNIRNYLYYISTQTFKVGFLRSKYDVYHYSTHHLLFVSESDLKIQFEYVSVSAVSIRIRSLFTHNHRKYGKYRDLTDSEFLPRSASTWGGSSLQAPVSMPLSGRSC
jgi:hypothetical protein